jgi:hypothetical protein
MAVIALATTPANSIPRCWKQEENDSMAYKFKISFDMTAVASFATVIEAADDEAAKAMADEITERMDNERLDLILDKVMREFAGNRAMATNGCQVEWEPSHHNGLAIEQVDD